jgi:Holliday junction resolvasome RuvABC endonuclease subunit
MAQISIIGLDPGTAHTGYSCLLGDLSSGCITLEGFGMLKTKKADGEVRERIDTLGDGLRKLAGEFGASHIALEDFTEQGKLVGKTYKEMSWLTEHFRMVGRELGAVTEVYENGYWKKVLLKAARANKAQVEHYVRHRLPESGALLNKAPNHVWDSVAIGICMFHLLTTGGKQHGKRGHIR